MAHVVNGQRPELRGIVSDLDGTLLRSNGSLSPRTMSMLDAARQQPVPLVIATARTPRAIRKIAGHDQLGIMVCANGAIVWDAAGDEIIEEHHFATEHVVAAVAELRRVLPGVGVALMSALTIYLDDAYVALRGKGAAGAMVVRDVTEAASNGLVVVSVRHRDRRAEHLIDLVSRTFDGVGAASYAGPSTVDVVPFGCDKAASVESVLGRAGCSLRDVVVFGDMPNDLGMFEAAGWTCAVANAHPYVVAVADEIVGSNDDDGVARTVHQIFGL